MSHQIDCTCIACLQRECIEDLRAEVAALSERIRNLKAQRDLANEKLLELEEQAKPPQKCKNCGKTWYDCTCKETQ